MGDREFASLLDKDPLSTDLLVSLLWAAAANYKHDTLVRPFPPQYLKNDHEQKDIELLVKDVSLIPSIADVVQGRKPLGVGCRKLLEWMLKDRHWFLVYHPPSKFNDIVSLTGAASYSVKPQHIFEVVYSADVDSKFSQLESSHGKMYGYHGSRVENFHSILHNGLLGHMNKTSLFGEGTYLSSDLVVAMTFSPSGNIWKNSTFSAPISIVAACEIINHPDVRCSVPGREHATNKTGTSIGGSVPDKYYVVTNNEHVRVKHILIFETSSQTKQRRHKSNWIMQNKFLVSIIAYLVLLLLIGLWRSQYFNKVYRKFTTW